MRISPTTTENIRKKPSITREQLDRLIAAAGGARQVEDIYPLSPLQQGLLFHSLYAPDSTAYVISVEWRLRGELDEAALERAWGQVLQRHALFRTAFVGQELERPLQVVHRNVQLPLQRYDWRGLSAQEQEERLRRLRQADREQGFEFSKPPLMRLSSGSAGSYLAPVRGHYDSLSAGVACSGSGRPVLLRMLNVTT